MTHPFQTLRDLIARRVASAIRIHKRGVLIVSRSLHPVPCLNFLVLVLLLFIGITTKGSNIVVLVIHLVRSFVNVNNENDVLETARFVSTRESDDFGYYRVKCNKL